MNDTNYKVLFEGKVLPNFDDDHVRENLAELFNVDDETIERLFSGPPYEVRRDIPEWKAREYASSILSAGGQCRIVSMDGETELPVSQQEAMDDFSEDDEPLGDSGDMFSMISRMGRARWLALGWLVILLVAAAFLLPDHLPELAGSLLSEGQTMMAAIALYCLAGLFTLFLIISRLHDMDRNGWLFLLLLIPVVNLLFLFWLALGQGSDGWNRYGEEPGEPGAIAIVMGIYMPLLFLVVAAAGIYLSQDSLMNMLQDLPQLASEWADLVNPG